MTIVNPSTQEISHLTDYAYRAVRQIAEENNKFIDLGEFDLREDLKDVLKNCISQFNKPVIIGNIVINVLVETFFTKFKDEKDCFTYKLNDVADTFDIHCNPLLPGMHDDFVIFSEDTFDNATIVKFNPKKI